MLPPHRGQRYTTRGAISLRDCITGRFALTLGADGNGQEVTGRSCARRMGEQVIERIRRTVDGNVPVSRGRFDRRMAQHCRSRSVGSRE